MVTPCEYDNDQHIERVMRDLSPEVYVGERSGLAETAGSARARAVAEELGAIIIETSGMLLLGKLLAKSYDLEPMLYGHSPAERCRVVLVVFPGPKADAYIRAGVDLGLYVRSEAQGDLHQRQEKQGKPTARQSAKKASQAARR